MGYRIDSVDVRRRKCVPRRDPYWMRLTKGRYIGYRKMAAGREGTWLARAYDGAKYVYHPLDDFAALPDGERYDAAKKAAEEWFKHLDLGGSTAPCSVKAACEAYLDYLRAEKSERAAMDAEGYFRRLVYSDPISKILLSKLTKAHMADWRERVLFHNPDRSSFNRNITALRAALNRALERGQVATDQAWLLALRPFNEQALLEQGERRRTVTLDLSERRRLIEKSSEDVRPFFIALALLPMRPGEVAGLKVSFLKPRERILDITGKTGRREVPLSQEALSHFQSCAKGKLPGAWLVSRPDGSQWKKEQWRDEIKLAARKARLPRATVAYTLRHSVITDLIVGGLDIFTVAKLAGTSVRIIEKHYGHLRSDHARKALDSLALAVQPSVATA